MVMIKLYELLFRRQIRCFSSGGSELFACERKNERFVAVGQKWMMIFSVAIVQS